MFSPLAFFSFWVCDGVLCHECGWFCLYVPTFLSWEAYCSLHIVGFMDYTLQLFCTVCNLLTIMGKVSVHLYPV